MMDLDPDIFISYAHIDNQTPIEGEEGWVSNLHRALEVRVAQLRGEKTGIWRDPKLQGNDVFADTLVHKLSHVGVLVSVLSPRYVKSDWCQREVEEFCHATEASGGLRVGDKARIFKVLKTPVPPESHPDLIKPLLGYRFFTEDPKTGRVRELDKMFGPEAEQEFWTQLEDLAQDIAALLDQLEFESEGQSGGPEASGAAPAGDAPGVYLAACSRDLRDERDALRRFLEREGFEVYPKQNLPLEIDELTSAVRQDLTACQLSIHPVGRSYGIVPEGSTESVVVVQSRLALEHSQASGLARMLWIPFGSEAEEARQQEFVDHLRSDAEVLQGADLLERPLEDLKGVVRAWLEKERIEKERIEKERQDVAARKAREPAQQAPGTAPGSDDFAVVYLICEQGDLEAATEVQDLLFDRGCEVVLPVFEGDESDVREEHEENLRSCHGALVYWGAGSEVWQRRKLREIQKIAGYGREQPIAAKAVLIAPPDTPEKARLRSREARILDLRAGIGPETLEPFLEDLRTATGALNR